MTTEPTTQILSRYNAWANEAMFEAVAALPANELIRDRPTLFKNIINTLNHIYVVDLIWQAHIEQREHRIQALNTVLYSDFTSLRHAQQEIDDWYIRWSCGLSEADADTKIRFTLIGGKPGEMRLGEIVLHVFNHTSYHRGFIADMFYQIPARPPLTDLPVFLMSQSCMMPRI